MKSHAIVLILTIVILITLSACIEPIAYNDPDPEPLCGNSVVESGEECDAGELNGVMCTPPDGGTCTYCSDGCMIMETEAFPEGTDGGDTTGAGIPSNGVDLNGPLGQMPSLTQGLREVMRYDPTITGPQHGVVAPPGAIIIEPSDDANSMIRGQPEGTVFFFTKGVHRGVSVSGSNLKDGMQFIGEYGAILNGAEPLSGFVQQGNLWVLTGRPYSPSVYELSHFKNEGESGYSSGECSSTNLRCDFWADLYLDDKPLRHVDSLTRVDSPGTWFYDYEAGTIHLYDDPTDRTVEIGKTFWAISNGEQPGVDAGARNVVVRNLIIEKYRTQEQRGVIRARWGFDWIIENNEIRYNHAVGVNLGTGSVLRNNIIHTNGQMGISATGEGVLIENNEIAHNNYAGYNWGWEAGASKFVRTTGLVARHNYVHGNDGPGLWTDIANDGTLYEYNIVDDNNGPGLFHEISYSGTIRYNLARDNYYGHHGSGVRISTSGPVRVYGNELIVRSPIDGVGTSAIGISNDNRAPYSYATVELSNNTIALRSEKSRAVMFWLNTDLGPSQVLVTDCDASVDGNTYYVPRSSDGRLFNRPSLESYYGDHVDLDGWRAFCGFDQQGTVLYVDDPAAELY